MPRLRLDPTSPTGVSIAPDDMPRQNYGYVSNKATGLITAGTNVTLTGNGTDSSPYVINSSGGGGGGTTLPADAAGWLHDNGTGTLAWTTPVKGDVGLGSVDNTSDANKPVSTAQQTALNLKANIASPTFTGTVTIPTGASITAPTGLVKGDIGLGNVDNTSDATKNSAVAAITNKDLTGAGNTFPTFNQNTTGSAAKWTTPRNLAGNSVDGSANVAFANKFIVQGTADTGLSAAQFLGALSTGILKVTTTTGVLSTAVAADFPTLNQNTTGTAANVTGTVAIANGGTGSTTAATARTALSAAQSGNNNDITTLTASPIITSGTVTANPIVPLGIASKQYVDNVTVPISTGVSGLGSGVATFLATPSSANLAGALTDETGTGAAVFATTPSLTTPIITGSASVASTPSTGNGKLFGVGTSTVRPHWINSSGTDETVLTDAIAPQFIGYQSDTTNSTPTKLKLQAGWGYFQGNSTNVVTKAITFPTAYTTVLLVTINILGAKTTGVPTALTDFTVAIAPETPIAYPQSITTSGFTAKLAEGASNPSTVYYGFQWVAYGT